MTAANENAAIERHPRRGLFTAVVVLALISTSTLLAQSSQAPEPLITRAARQIGVKRCLPVIAATASRVTAGASRQDIVLDWDRQAPDNGPVFSLTGLQFGAQTAALTITAMPAPDGRCSLLVERVSVARSPCVVVAKSDLQALGGTPLIPGIMVYSSPNAATETYTLIDEAQSCLIIRRQTVFNWPQRR